MHRITTSKDKLSFKIWKFINKTIFNLILLVTFLGILPVTIFTLLNIIEFNCVKVITGCCLVLTLVKVNKSIQG